MKEPSLHASWPSGDKRKSTYTRNAFGWGASRTIARLPLPAVTYVPSLMLSGSRCLIGRPREINSVVITSLGPIAMGYLPLATKLSICPSSRAINKPFVAKNFLMKSLPSSLLLYQTVAIPKPPPARVGVLITIFPSHLGLRRSFHDLKSVGET